MTRGAAWPRRAGATALSLVAALSAACSAGGGSAGQGSSDGLRGTATAVQDVEGLSEQDLESGWVVAVPEASADELLATGGAGDGDEDELPYVSARLSREQVLQAGGVLAEIRGGRFSLDVAPGDHLVCLLQEVDGGDQRTRGCDRAALPGSGRVALTVGEGGVRVEVRR